MIILLPVIICVVGLLMFMLSANPKVAEVGRIMFAVGLFVTIFTGAPVISGYIK